MVASDGRDSSSIPPRRINIGPEVFGVHAVESRDAVPVPEAMVGFMPGSLSGQQSLVGLEDHCSVIVVEDAPCPRKYSRRRPLGDTVPSVGMSRC